MVGRQSCASQSSFAAEAAQEIFEFDMKARGGLIKKLDMEIIRMRAARPFAENWLAQNRDVVRALVAYRLPR
jgi:hypothetical protein